MLNLALKSEIKKLIQQGKFDKARVQCITLCENTPHDIEAHVLAGVVHGQLGDFKSAEGSLLKAFAMSPNDPSINFNLGLSFYHQNRFKEAIEYLARAAQLDENVFDVWFYLGMSCEAEGAKDNAIVSFERAMSLNPDSDVVLNCLAKQYMETGRWEFAVEVLERLFKKKPVDSNVLFSFCVALCRSYQYERLLKNIEPVALSRPMDIVSNYHVAQAHFEQADMTSAECFFKRVLAADPGHVDSQVGLASIKTILGEHDAALQILSPLVDSHPDSPGVAISFSAIGPKFNRKDDAIRLLENSFNNMALPDYLRGKIAVFLGQIYEKSGEYEKAFSYFKLGNDLHSPGFDRARYLQSIKAIESVYTEDSIQDLPVAKQGYDKPIFIIGMPRSGTSLVEQILASHPDVYGAGELAYIQNYTFEISDTGVNTRYPECMAHITNEHLEGLAKDYIGQLESLSNGEDWVTDKMPTNYQNLGLIYQLFPNAKIIHCVRNPMDTCVSCYSQFFSGSYYTFDLDDLGFAYRAYEKQMKLWKKILPVSILDVPYEDLVQDQEEVTRRILEYCALPWSDACLDFHKTSRKVATASVDQVRQPLYKSSVGKWENYEQHLGALINSLEVNKNI